MKYDICVVGLGYIGLPTATIFASKGRRVLGVDVSPRVVETINQGKVHIVEPDLDMFVQGVVRAGHLVASLKPAESDCFIIAVPTPFKPVGDNPRAPDLTYVESATRSIAPYVRPGNLVILESTSPVGTTKKVSEWLFEEQCRLGIASASEPGSLDKILFAHCPERVLPGKIIQELVSNDRLAGGLTPEAAQRAKALYEIFCSGEVVLTDAPTAELVKLAENSFRDVNIAFANELSMICDKLGLNVWELIRLANRHPRVKILQPGPGVGGHCIAVDPWFIVDSAPTEARLIRTAREVNDSKPHHVIEAVRKAVARVNDPVIACLGLSFKADIDDLRESPAVEIVEHLAHEHSTPVLVVEPHIKELPVVLGRCASVSLVDLPTALARANIILLLVNHKVFGGIGKSQLATKVVVDTRGVWA